MKTVAIVLARGASKGIPKKNIIDFCGKPLLAWTIEHCLDGGVDSIYVSSDSDEILEILYYTHSRANRNNRDISWRSLDVAGTCCFICGSDWRGYRSW